MSKGIRDKCKHLKVRVVIGDFGVWDRKDSIYSLIPESMDSEYELEEDGAWDIDEDGPREERLVSIFCYRCGKTLFEDGMVTLAENDSAFEVIGHLADKIEATLH